jgi:squalene-hopene/tetraprenyl-beta-curcumene cyclase
METSRIVRIIPMEGLEEPTLPLPQRTATYQRLAPPVRRAIMRTRQWLLSEQHADGFWCAELEGDTILESEYILLLAYLGRETSDTAKRCAQYIIDKQLPEGGWSMYPGGAVEISGSVKAYFALKLTGHDPSAEYMQRARQSILRHGGADAVNSFTRFYLALLGQISYDQCPAVPPEVVLLPQWFPINMYRVSAWSRTMIVTLSIMSALQPVTPIDPQRGIRELFINKPENWPELRCPGLKGKPGLFSWDTFFRAVDKGFKFMQRNQVLPLRRRALAACEKWMTERFERSEGLGAIFPPMVWSIIALRALGYDDESTELQYCYKHLEGLIIEAETTTRLQPCKSPVWDTAIALRALADSGVRPDHPNIEQAVKWLLDNQILKPGDWSATVKAEPGGWCFEHANDFYPDNDDTAMVIMALFSQFEPNGSDTLPPEFEIRDRRHRRLPNESSDRAEQLARTNVAIERAERWLVAMQNSDGGWGAFDKDNDHEFLCHVPFADHNAMIDPSSPDLAARALEALGKLGRRIGDPVVDRGVAYLRQSQEADGSWFGRWGVNYIYGTWQVIVGLRAVGIPADDEAIVAGVNWLLACQQASGAWGESCDSYEDSRLKGQGNATASQTAWAVLGLIAAGHHGHASTVRAIRWLIAEQREDGVWEETEFTGTGFPRVFYLRYHMYPIYFPLMALSQWAKSMGAYAVEELATIPIGDAQKLKAES